MYVVTGGAGFIGSHVVAELEARGLDVAVVDDLNQAKWPNIAKRKPAMIVPQRDLMFRLNDAPTFWSGVIHMGAISSTASKDVQSLVATNATLTADLFTFCAKRSIPFVYASSAAVYGASLNQQDFSDHIYIEALKPTNGYGWSKKMAELWVANRAFSGAREKPPRWAGLRLFNVYGPNEWHKGDQRSFVTKCFDAIANGEKIELFKGSETFMRDWIAAEDVARLVVNLIASSNSFEGFFNVGAGDAVSFADVVRACATASGKPAPIRIVPFPEARFFDYQKFTRADTTRLAKIADFNFAKLADGAEAYWRDHACKEGLERYR